MNKTLSTLELAKECLEEAKGDWNLAHDIGMERFKKHPKLLLELLAAHISEIFWLYIRRIAKQQRMLGPMSSSSSPSTSKDGQRLMGMRNLLAFPLTGGKRVGDATRPELIEQGKLYKMMASSNAQRDRWFSLVAAALPDDRKLVSDVFDNEQLNELWRQSQHGS